ncbi:hypothetical protein ONZ43_g7580 [Nemania bipapillata]|uniref:Uncharacterized protein n=1 Tax=Nemania bipapillata TaxID=110536 RepID=A0ACC2HR88_9PEZI|nr:hypothetical protein ONZ43_g7580 [Nemania bipapillata]
MALVHRTLAYAAVERLCSAYVPYKRIDIEVQGLITLPFATTQRPANDGGNVAIPHVPASGDAAIVSQNLAEAAIFPLELSQPR